MPFSRSRRLVVLAAIGVLSLGMIAPSMAAYAAEDSGLQDRVDAVLAEFPGGTQTMANEISWDGGQMILTLATGDDSFAARAVGSCATGYYCAYSGYNLSGSKLSFSACNTTQSTSALSVVRSIANARSSGSVQGKNSSGSVLATIGANGSLGYAPVNITRLTCIS